MKNRLHNFIVTTLALLCMCHFISTPALAEEHPRSFKAWLDQVTQEARTEGITREAVDYIKLQAKFVAPVIALDRAQPEFVQSFSTYISQRITPKVIQNGKDLIKKHHNMLHAVEQLYGVPKEVLGAFWGLETAYGKNLGDFDLASSLVTLAYEGRRASFFKNELFAFMRVLDAEKHYKGAILGSWAGASGQMQFMPSTLLEYGIDGDEDYKVNMHTSLPDVFTSAANYLTEVGWQAEEPIAVAVVLPKGFDYSLAQLNIRKHARAWLQLGVPVPKEYLELNNVAVILPQGYKGPAFLVFTNFNTVMEWNRSISYALSVSMLSQHLAGKAPNVKLVKDDEGISFEQAWSLQAKLNSLGFDSGPPDGFVGIKTQAAIRSYQASVGLPQDGYASLSLYKRLAKN